MSVPERNSAKTNQLVHSEHPKESAPHVGHEGTSYEGVDASVRMVVMSLVIIAGILLVTMAITLPMQRFFRANHPLGNPPSPLTPARVVPPKPQIEVHPWEELPDLRAHEDQVLNSTGTDAAGRVHIPINLAMDSVMSKLTIRPDAPQGITVPGGQGRDFSFGLSSMPPQYQTPTIQGEIQKNAVPSTSH
jgi:hypothetical protein